MEAHGDGVDRHLDDAIADLERRIEALEAERSEARRRRSAVAGALGFATEAGFSLPGVSALRRAADG